MRELTWRKRRDIYLLSLFIIMLAFVVKNCCFTMRCLWLLYRGTPFEPFPDSLSPEEILEQAQGAAKEARQELSMRKPKTDVSSHGVLLCGTTGAICWCDVTHSRLAQSVWRCDVTHGTWNNKKVQKPNIIRSAQYVKQEEKSKAQTQHHQH